MEKTTKYNGWVNRATWNVNLWLMNKEPNYRACVAFAKSKNVSTITVERFCRETFGTSTPDGDQLNHVGAEGWAEVARSIKECQE